MCTGCFLIKKDDLDFELIDDDELVNLPDSLIMFDSTFVDSNIINFKLHPIDNFNYYVKSCRSQLKKKSILVLNSFLTEESLSQKETPTDLSTETSILEQIRKQ